MRGVLLTGLPGVGKTTACCRVAEICRERGFRIEGFITEELRERGVRQGFDIVEFTDGRKGCRAPLARVGGGPGGPRVGKYAVTVPEFEAFVLPLLDRIAGLAPTERVVCIIDEIGKMELFSRAFVSRVRAILDARPVPVLFTIALHGGGFIAEAKRTPGLDLVTITHETRDAAPEELMTRLLGDASPPPCADPAPAPAAGARSSGTEAPAPPGGPPPAAAEGGCVVLWFRTDLRLADNPLLRDAVQRCRSRNAALVPVFCCDPREFGAAARTAFGSPKTGAWRRQFVEDCLEDLAAGFASRGSWLLVCDASPETVLPALVTAGDIVLAVREACPEERAAEARVHTALQRVGAALELADSGGVTTLFGEADLAAAGLRTGDAFPEDFQVFHNAVKGRVRDVCETGLCAAPATLPAPRDPASPPPGLRAAATASDRPRCTPPAAAGPALRGGEAAALGRLRTWLQSGGLRTYKTTFRRLTGDYSSRLSAPLACGCVSPRRVAAEALAAVRSGPHVEHFLYELCWRDFFRRTAQRWGPALFAAAGPLGAGARGTARRDWRRDAEAEDRWRRGMTGVPLVDAAMREMAATGYMGNLARQFVAAFVVEELALDWRVGADWFEAALTDYDVHSNWGQWARSAGVAPTNEAKRRRVGGTRYFDLALQLGGDEAARYIRAWVPEVAGLPGRHVLAPWGAAGTAPEGYPQPPLCSDALRKYFEQAALGAGSAAEARAAGRGQGEGSARGARAGGKGKGGGSTAPAKAGAEGKGGGTGWGRGRGGWEGYKD